MFSGLKVNVNGTYDLMDLVCGGDWDRHEIERLQAQIRERVSSIVAKEIADRVAGEIEADPRFDELADGIRASFYAWAKALTDGIAAHGKSQGGGK